MSDLEVTVKVELILEFLSLTTNFHKVGLV